MAGASQTTVTTVTKKAKAMPLVRSPMLNRSHASVGQGFPKKLTMTHRWTQTIGLSTGSSGALNTFVFRANGMFDPSVTGGAHQPYYFTQLSAIYDHFTVIGSKIKITASKTDSSTSIPITCGIMINDDSTVTPTLLGLLEHPSSTWKLLENTNKVTLSNKWSAKKTFGGSILGNDNLQGTSAADPTEQSTFVFFMDSSVNAIATSVTFVVEIDYIAVWDELKDIANNT